MLRSLPSKGFPVALALAASAFACGCAGAPRSATTAAPPADPALAEFNEESVRATLGNRQDGVRNCYERRLRVNSLLRGRLAVAITILPDGSVIRLEATEDSVGDAEVTRCALGLLRATRFPPPVRGTVTITAPFSLVPTVVPAH